MGWIHLAQNGDQWWTLMNMVMNIRVPQNVGELLSSWATGGFLRTWIYAVSLELIVAHIDIFFKMAILWCCQCWDCVQFMLGWILNMEQLVEWEPMSTAIPLSYHIFYSTLNGNFLLHFMKYMPNWKSFKHKLLVWTRGLNFGKS